MSVNATFYVVHGTKIPYDAKLADALYDYQDKYGYRELPFVADGMMGEYIVLGNILYSADAREGEEFREIPLSEVTSQNEAQYRMKFAEVFPDHIHKLEHPFEILAFVNYS